jgi:cytochrome c-type biogenesis protein CcmH
MKSRTLWTILLVIILAGLGSGVVSAQGPTPTDDDVNRIAKQLFCPVCENTPLDVCPTEACRQWRELIRQMLSEGKTEQEIKDYFVLNYGARVLSEPPRSGFNWLVYVIPPMVIVAGVFILFRAMRAWTQSSEASPEGTQGVRSGEDKAAGSSGDDDYVARMEEELKKRK